MAKVITFDEYIKIADKEAQEKGFAFYKADIDSFSAFVDEHFNLKGLYRKEAWDDAKEKWLKDYKNRMKQKDIKDDKSIKPVSINLYFEKFNPSHLEYKDSFISWVKNEKNVFVMTQYLQTWIVLFNEYLNYVKENKLIPLNEYLKVIKSDIDKGNFISWCQILHCNICVMTKEEWDNLKESYLMELNTPINRAICGDSEYEFQVSTKALINVVRALRDLGIKDINVDIDENISGFIVKFK